MEINVTARNDPDSKIYNYIALDKLVDDIDEILSKNNINDVKINAYEIKNTGKIPYLKYLLLKNPSNDILFFPELEISSLKINSLRLILLAKLYLFGILRLGDYDTFEKNICFKGFYINNEEVHIFFDLSDCNLNIDNRYRKNTLWFCLIDEIINHNSVCDFCIDSSISNFFINNSEFCFLKNKNNNNYELPIVGYIGIQQSKLNFTYTFGISAKDKNSILGPYYYFTDYSGSIREGGWSETGKPVIKDGIAITDNDFGRFKHSGIVRFALFLGKMKIIENLLDDENDNSEIKKERLNDTNLNHNMEVLTMRISDHEGKWSETYDSVFLGKIELDNGEYLKNTPIFVLKKYEQQIPLSYHYIDKSYLNDTYDENDKYIIM